MPEWPTQGLKISDKFKNNTPEEYKKYLSYKVSVVGFLEKTHLNQQILDLYVLIGKLIS